MPLRWDDDSTPFDDLPWSAHNAETGVLSVNARTSRNAGRIEIPAGTHLILDFGTLFGGYAKFHPKFAAVVLPAHEGMPDKPNDPDFKPALQLQLLIQNFGMSFFTTTSTFNINAINRLISMFRRAPQAIAGELPIYKLLQSDAVVWGDGTYYPIAMEQTGWTPRGDDVFSARIVPPPRGRPTVVGFTPPQVLPGATETAPAAAAPPTSGSQSTSPSPTAQSATPPFDGPYTGAAAPAAQATEAPSSAPVAESPAATTAPESPAVSPAPDPFAIFRRGNNPVPQPIPQPRSAA